MNMNKDAYYLGTLVKLKCLYRLVIDTMKDIEGDRKCFHMIGGVLVEQSVKEVLPAPRKKEQVSCL